MKDAKSENLGQKINRLLTHPLFGAATLLAIQARFLWGSWHNWDLPLWDGSVYFANGRTLLATFHFPSLEWSPLFAIYYATFQAILGSLGPFLAYYSHRVVTQALILLLLYWFLRKSLRPLTAWVLGIYFILLWIPITNAYVIHNFILIPMLVAYLLAFHQGRYKQGLILAVLLLACLVRPEMILAFLAYGMFLTISAIRQHKYSIEWLNYTPVAAVLALGLIILLRTPVLSTNRLWAAFGQHYAWGYSERHPEWGKDPMLHWEEITQIQFDGAQNLWQAARVNPGAIATHILWNLHILPGQMRLVLRPFYPWLEWLLIVGLIGLAISLIRAIIQHGWDFKAWISTDQTRLSFWILLIASLFPGIFSLLIIRPRAIYLVTFVPVVLLLVGIGLDGWLPDSLGKSGLVILTLAVACLIIFPTPFEARGGRPVRNISNTLSHLHFSQRFTLLSESAKAFCVYAQPQTCQPLEIGQVPAQIGDFATYLQDNHVEVIITNTRLIQNLPPSGKQFMSRLQSDPTATGFKQISHSGDFTLYMRAR